MVEMSIRTVISLFFIMVFVFLVWPIYGVMKSSAEGQLEKQLCKTSVGVRINTNPLGVWSPFDLFCPRKFVQISEDVMVRTNYEFMSQVGGTGDYAYFSTEMREGKVVRVSELEPPKTDAFEEEFSQVLAYELAECWETFLEGRSEILSSDSLVFRENTCVVCAEIVLDRPDISESELDLTGYLRSTPSHTFSSEPQTYYSYLYDLNPPSRSLACAEQSYPQDQITLRSQESYSVVFFRWASKGRTVDKVALGMDENTCQGTAVIPTRELPKHCRVVVN